MLETDNSLWTDEPQVSKVPTINKKSQLPHLSSKLPAQKSKIRSSSQFQAEITRSFVQAKKQSSNLMQSQSNNKLNMTLTPTQLKKEIYKKQEGVGALKKKRKVAVSVQHSLERLYN